MSSGSNSRAEQTLGTSQLLNRQSGPIGSNKPTTASNSTPSGVILPPTHDNRIQPPTPADQGGPVLATSGHIWPRLDFSENLQTPPGGAGAFTAQQFANFSSNYVSFAVPLGLQNRKIYAYYNVIFPNVGAPGVVVGAIHLWRKGNRLLSLPLSLYGGTANTGGFGLSLPFVCGTGLAGYESLGLNLQNLQAGEASPVSLVPSIVQVNCDKITVDLDTTMSTATNISSLRIWVGCYSY